MTRRTRYGVLFLLMAGRDARGRCRSTCRRTDGDHGSVTAVGATTATVTGTVNPGGVATTWYVEYGTSTCYGSQTASTNAGSGTGNTAVSVSLAGLAQGTTYHYRVVATNICRHGPRQ